MVRGLCPFSASKQTHVVHTKRSLQTLVLFSDSEGVQWCYDVGSIFPECLRSTEPHKRQVKC